MTASVIAWLAVALLVFWALGAYNRLVRLRAAVLARFSQLDQHMLQGLVLLGDAGGGAQSTAASAETPLEVADSSVSDGLQAATIQFEICLRVARKQALDASAVAALQSAYATVRDVWMRREGLSSDAPSADAAEVHRAWDGNTQLVRQAAANFNAAVESYNAAIGQFPASVLAHVFGFKSAAQL